MKALMIEKVDGKPGEVYYPLKINEIPKPQPQENEVVVKMLAAALNHREIFIRQQLYPQISFEAALGADGVGIVVECGSTDLERQWKGKKVIITPGQGWQEREEGPDPGKGERYTILGGAKGINFGTMQEYAAVPVQDIELAPQHLSVPEAAALPLCGLTAYRATFTKAKLKKGQNVLITGIGGGVALFALQFAIAVGATVFVTSGSSDKIARAKEMGATNGVNYKDTDWPRQLKAMLPKERPYLDSVIDGAGGDISLQTTPLLKTGGIIAIYGMTQGPQISVSMGSVLKNIDIRGSTMGSRREFTEMVQFAHEHKIKPVVDMVVNGLEQADECFETMKNGKQFGKLVIVIAQESETSKL